MTIQILYWIFGALLLGRSSLGAVLAPPWADPKINPCASKPRGWQMLYWPEDGNCYKIFKVSILMINYLKLFKFYIGNVFGNVFTEHRTLFLMINVFHTFIICI